MASIEDKNKKTKIPYEPPRLFDFGGGVAHAAEQCLPGGSPTVGACQSGSGAVVSHCLSGGAAGGKCEIGNAASGGACGQGSTASGRCKAGGTPR